MFDCNNVDSYLVFPPPQSKNKTQLNNETSQPPSSLSSIDDIPNNVFLNKDDVPNAQQKLSISQILKRKAIDMGKMFQVKQMKMNELIPKVQCGFKMSFISMDYLYCRTEVDLRAVVSLALLNHRSPILEAYGNKLYIMVVNVSRLMYTLEAFTLKNENCFDRPLIQQALEFYVRTDIKFRKKTSPPNQQFSEFLHRLRSSGYIEYIFDLAREINLNVDYIVDARIAARYIKDRGDINNQVSSPIGYLTAIHESNNEWYVKTTRDSILSS